MKKRHTFFYHLLRPLVVLFLKLRFGYTYEKAKNLPKTYIVVANHATDYDMLLVAASFRRQMYFLGSEHIARWKRLYPLLRYAFDPIMRPKGASAAKAVMEMVRRARKGRNVCLFPEGVRTWDGRPSPITPAIAKLIQSANCGLVTYRLTGGYFVSPQWGDGLRRGRLHGAPVRIFSPEEVAAMTVDELYAVITHDIGEDAYARQAEDPAPYRSKAGAKGMENLLFICPQCGAYHTITTDGDTISCTACDLRATYDAYGYLHGLPVDTVAALADWQRAQVARDVAEGKPYTAARGILLQVKDHTETQAAEGEITLTPDTLRVGDKAFALGSVTEMAMHGKKALVFTADKVYYELLPQNTNTLRFLWYYNACVTREKETV